MLHFHFIYFLLVPVANILPELKQETQVSNDDTFTSDTNYNADSNNTDSNSSATSATETEEEVEKAETTTTTISKPLFQKGQKIQAQCEGWAKAYPGIIDVVNTRSDDTTSYGITFEDGEIHDNVTETQIDDSVDVPFVVGLKVRAKFAGKGHFYPAIISKVNVDGTFDLKYMDGDWEEGALKDNLTVC